MLWFAWLLPLVTANSQVVINATKDTFILNGYSRFCGGTRSKPESCADVNFGDLNRVEVGPAGSDRFHRGLFYFPLEGLPRKKLKSAKLLLPFRNTMQALGPYVKCEEGSSMGCISVHELTKGWKEETVTWNSGNTRWTQPGGDYIYESIGQGQPNNGEIILDVKRMEHLLRRIEKYHGFLLKDDNNQGFISFHSKEANHDKKPQLTLEYVDQSTRCESNVCQGKNGRQKVAICVNRQKKKKVIRKSRCVRDPVANLRENEEFASCGCCPEAPADFCAS